MECAQLFCRFRYTLLMTLTLELSPAEEVRPADAAPLNGLEPTTLVKKLLTEHLPPVRNGNGMSALTQSRLRDKSTGCNCKTP